MELKQRSIQKIQLRKYTFEYHMSMYASKHSNLVALFLAHDLVICVIFVTVSTYKQIISYTTKIAKFM